MKKSIKGLLTVSLAAALSMAAACGGGADSWKGNAFTNYGTVQTETLGGLAAETDKYVYFINGVGSSSWDNSYGTPVKGALVAADKNNPSDVRVVIPELMVSSDYGAGVYIFNEGGSAYAYYGTPNREKNSSGEVANYEMTFTKTRLDGKESEKLFTVSSHSTTYRVAQAANGKVYILYYDTSDSALVSYDCKADKKTVIAKTDAKSNVKTNDEYLSLGEYKFLDNGSGAQIAYVMNVYSEAYIEAKAESEDSYSREQANYNKLYVYSVDGGASCVKDGNASKQGATVEEDTKYALKSNVGEYLFYTATPLVGQEQTYGVKISDLSDAVKIDYPDNIKDDIIIVDYDKVYYYDTDSQKVLKNTLVKTDTINEHNTKKAILKDGTISSLIKISDDYIYCFNSDGYIVAIERAENGKTIRISERVAASSWYKPETVKLTVGGEEAEYLLYCDGSTEGNSYVYRAKLDFSDENVKEEDTNDDGETDIYYLESSFTGVRTAADRAKAAVIKISAIESTLDLEEGDDDKLYSESVKIARAAYDALDKDAKAEVSEDDLAKLVNAEKAVVLANLFVKLEPVLYYDLLLTADQKAALEADYNAAKAKVNAYGDDYETIAAYLDGNLNYYYQQTKNKIG